MSFTFRLLSFLCLALAVNARSDGAPGAACEALSPRHANNVAQTEPGPYAIKVNSTTVESGDVIEVTITSDIPETVFKGFILQAREDISVYETRGSFIVEEGVDAKPSTCLHNDDTVTHKDSTAKSDVKVYYRAPLDFEGVVIITGTVLQQYTTFYEKQQSAKITVKNTGQTEAPTSSTETPPTSSTETPSTSSTEKPPEDAFFDGCGTTKSCFGQPDNCVDRKSCNFATTVSKSSQGDYYFELISFQKEAQYVALALSTREFMSETTVMECVKTTNGHIVQYDSWMSMRPRGVSREGIPQDTTTSLSVDSDDRMFSCRFKRAAQTTVKGETFDLDNTQYHLLLASGTRASLTGIEGHDLGAKPSDKRLLGDITPFKSPSNLLYKLHGVFMFTAWIGTSTIGIFFARYFKKQWKGQQMMQKDLWFVGHQTSMILTWILTMIGFILIFVKLGAWSATNNPHPILGLITTILCFIQPLGALFRPAPNAPNRRWFNWLHFVIGNTAHFLGLISIFFAVSLTKAELPFEMYYIMIAFGVYYAVAHIFFSVATESENLNVDKTSLANFKGSGCKNFLLIVHVIIVLTLNIAGIVLIFQPAEVTEM